MIRCARYALAVLLVALAGCSSPAPAAPTVTPSSSGLSADEAAFVAQARQIAPRIIGNDERLAARGKNTCTGLREGRPQPAVEAEAVQRFSSGSYSVTLAEAARLVEAARTTVCED